MKEDDDKEWDAKSADENDEEILYPAIRKPMFGIQLESPTREFIPHFATVTKAAVQTVVTEYDEPAYSPFLPATYTISSMKLCNPWNIPFDLSQMSSKAEANKEPILLDEKLEHKNMSMDAQPLGSIPYVLEAPSIAESKSSVGEERKTTDLENGSKESSKESSSEAKSRAEDFKYSTGDK